MLFGRVVSPFWKKIPEFFKKGVDKGVSWVIMELGGDKWEEVEDKSMFMGEYSHTLDGKGRLIIPAKFRSLLGQRFVIARVLDECLFVFPEKQWLSFEEKLKSLPVTDPKARVFSRFVFSGAESCSLDKSGRVCIPPKLRAYAGINEEVTVIGNGDRIEIWSKKKWDSYLSKTEESYKEFSEELAKLGI